jgi:hypothetical protein
MLHRRDALAGFCLALLMSLGLSVGWSSSSLADVYTFTFTSNPLLNPGWNVEGSFSIPTSDFAESVLSSLWSK